MSCYIAIIHSPRGLHDINFRNIKRFEQQALEEEEKIAIKRPTGIKRQMKPSAEPVAFDFALCGQRAASWLVIRMRHNCNSQRLTPICVGQCNVQPAMLAGKADVVVSGNIKKGTHTHIMDLHAYVCAKSFMRRNDTRQWALLLHRRPS